MVSCSSVVEEVAVEVERLRGLEFKRTVPVEVIDDDAAREHVIRRMDRFQAREQLALTQRAYALLRLLPPGTDIVEAYLEALREQAGGFYDPESGSFFLLDDMPALMVHVLTAHELTHALEDQYYDLDRRLEEVMADDDRLFARGAVHEGSAMLLMSLYTAQGMISGKLDPAAATALAESEAGKADAMLALPPALLRQLLGPYVLGAGFLAQGNLLSLMIGGFPEDDVNRVYERGPLSSEQILHPEKYWNADQVDEPVTVEVVGVGKTLGRRWKRLAHGVLGELTLGVMVGADTPTDPQAMMTQDASSWTNDAAAGWDGDRWELWQRGQRTVALLSTVWDTEDDALEFAQALPADDTFSWRRAGHRVAIVAGDAGSRTERTLERLLAKAVID